MSTAVEERRRRDLMLSSVIQRAQAGDPTSVAMLVERVTPALILQASHRLGPQLRRHVDPQDVVNDVWLASLPRLVEFNPQGDGATRSLVAYLGVAVLRRVHRLQKIHLGRRAAAAAAAGAPDAVDAPVSQVADETSGIVSKALRHERHQTLFAAVAELDEEDRAVVVYRALEQHPNEVVAALTGLKPNTVSQRLRRALAKLRERLPESVFDDLADD